MAGWQNKQPIPGFQPKAISTLCHCLSLSPVWKTRRSTFRNLPLVGFAHFATSPLSPQTASFMNPGGSSLGQEVLVVSGDSNYHITLRTPWASCRNSGMVCSYPIQLLLNGSQIAQSPNIYWPELCVLGAPVYLQGTRNLVLNTHRIDGVFKILIPPGWLGNTSSKKKYMCPTAIPRVNQK